MVGCAHLTNPAGNTLVGVEAEDALELIDLRQRGVRWWVDGGWVVDALVGAQIRTHDDLDLAVKMVWLVDLEPG